MTLTAILDRSLTEGQVRTAVDHYVQSVLGPTYQTGNSARRNGQWHFTVLCHRDDMSRTPAVGFVAVDAATGQVTPLTDEQLHNLREAGAVQAAQERGELARDEQGYVLRYHAHIKANVWISNLIDLKVGVRDGVFLPLDKPVWRFAIDFSLADKHLDPLGVIDVDAQTGQVIPLTDEQLQSIRGCVRAIKRSQILAPAA